MRNIRNASSSYEAAVVFVVVVMLMLMSLVAARWDAEDASSYARFANCEASQACRSTRSVAR